MNADAKNYMLTQLAGVATKASLHDSGGTEVTGGTYARQTITWGTAAAGAISDTSIPAFNIPAGSTVARVKLWNTGGTVINLVRGATNILLPTSNGYSVFFNAWSSSLANTYFHGTVIPLVYLDSPATTSATTYKLQVGNNSGADTGYINRTIQDQVNSRTTSTITVMEISG